MFLILRLPDILWMGWDTVSEFGFTNSSFTDVFFATHTHTHTHTHSHTHTNTHTYMVNKQSYLIKTLKLNRQVTFEHRFQQGNQNLILKSLPGNFLQIYPARSETSQNSVQTSFNNFDCGKLMQNFIQ